MSSGKFNVTISGGSGSIIMGDRAMVNIREGGRGAAQGPPTVNVRSAPGRGPLHTTPRVPVHAQETAHAEDDVIHKITQGYALIIHNQYFQRKSDRRGSEKDVEAIRSFCENAGITVNNTSQKTENLTATEIDELCTEIAKRDFNRYDGFLCFILSHGSQSGIYGVDDIEISVQEIVSKFQPNPGLVGKPKLFFVQACRGSMSDEGVETDSHRVREKIPLRLPKESDTLIAYSTVDGYESYRSCEVGSWFIITLMRKLEDHAHHMHIMDILTLVNKSVAEGETPSDEKQSSKKQMPCQLTTLTKFVHFKYPSPLSS